MFLNPIQPAVRMKDSVPNKTVRMKNFQTSSSGKFCSAQLTLERGTLKHLRCSVFILLTFFFPENLIEDFDIHKANVIVDNCVLKQKIFTSIRTRNF